MLDSQMLRLFVFLDYPLFLLCPLPCLDTYSASNAFTVDALMQPARDTSIITNAVDAGGKEVSFKETETETEAGAAVVVAIL